MTAATEPEKAAAAQNPKTERRRAARELRDAMPAALRAEASAAICKKIVSMALFGLCDTVFCYSPVGSEVDVRPVIAAACAHGKRVALPTCDYATSDMEFYALGDGTLVENGPMHIPEPLPDPARRLTPTVGTLMLVPGLLFDRCGRRIGYGKGMYDRYIRRFPDFLRGSTAVGVSFHALLSDTPLPCTDEDVNLALVVTERGLVSARKTEKAPKRDGNPAEPRKCGHDNADSIPSDAGKYAPPRAKETKE